MLKPVATMDAEIAVLKSVNGRFLPVIVENELSDALGKLCMSGDSFDSAIAVLTRHLKRRAILSNDSCVIQIRPGAVVQQLPWLGCKALREMHSRIF